jgi:uncharacterized membrane protein YoaT (DUF817 family)
MYAAIWSYIMACWKLYGVTLKNAPSYALSMVVCVLIYMNFFTNHFVYDIRWFLFIMVIALYFKTDALYRIREKVYAVPLAFAFVWVGCAVWIAENIATYYGAWKYPTQIHVWQVVSVQKITSWTLLVIISFMLVAYLKHYKHKKGNG